MIRITDDTMTAHPSGATATRVADVDRNEQWVLAWMPDQTVSRNEAISGLMIAEYVLGAIAAERPLTAKEQMHVTAWARELNLTFQTALRLVVVARPVDVAELRRVFGEPVEGRDFFDVDHKVTPLGEQRRDWNTMRPRDFGLAETHIQTALLIQTDAGTLF